MKSICNLTASLGRFALKFLLKELPITICFKWRNVVNLNPSVVVLVLITMAELNQFELE